MYENMSFVYINQIVKPRSTSEAVLGQRYGPHPPIQPEKRIIIYKYGFCNIYIAKTYINIIRKKRRR